MSKEVDLKYHYKLNYRKNYNIVSKEYKVIYFNTQKNANTTMKAQFVEVLGMVKTEEFPKDVHSNYDFPTASQSEVISKYQNFLKFLIVRNPWERLVSCYTNKIKKNPHREEKHIFKCSSDLFVGMSFEEFVEVICEIPDSEADYHFCSQTYLMLYSDGYFPINYICNMENLAFHIEEIKALTGIPFSQLSNLNHSKSTSYEQFYTPELIEKVSQRYQMDIEFFKYQFGQKNETFPFGAIENDLKKNLTQSPFMIELLREKNKELVKTIEIIGERLPELEEMVKEFDVLKRQFKLVKNSKSWKITYPLRCISSLWK
ncbi:MAG: sulfotransferase family protein [Saprospiraceae bacterium]